MLSGFILDIAQFSKGGEGPECLRIVLSFIALVLAPTPIGDAARSRIKGDIRSTSQGSLSLHLCNDGRSDSEGSIHWVDPEGCQFASTSFGGREGNVVWIQFEKADHA